MMSNSTCLNGGATLQTAGSTGASTTASTTQTAAAPADQTAGAGPASGGGQTPGMLANTGAATYTIPIQAPAGRGGIAPNLALSYNSDQGNGWVGMGWTLDMGAIQRSTKTPGGMTYSTSDHFVSVINGSVSNLVRNSNWGPSNYENEIDGAFLNYYYNSTSHGWEVKDKSGTIYYYGTSASSRLSDPSDPTGLRIFKWLLDKVEDVNGNYMIVAYTMDRDTGQAYLSEIDYTLSNNGGGLAATNKITFDLTSRTDLVTSYASYWKVTTAKLLQTINVYGSGGLIRKYQLSYTQSAQPSARSLLQTVTQYGSDENSPLSHRYFSIQRKFTRPRRAMEPSDRRHHRLPNRGPRRGREIRHSLR